MNKCNRDKCVNMQILCLALCSDAFVKYSVFMSRRFGPIYFADRIGLGWPLSCQFT